ncbi:patatin-like serine [Nannochloropsis gaditana]|uniref:Patatin-like serine n=1 Tax=Nannochloropsis gaditana TaxID=72520 RepID=W7TY21_9STRA|nr:patatin-like serine [Nannochloropsis gaditana]
MVGYEKRYDQRFLLLPRWPRIAGNRTRFSIPAAMASDRGTGPGVLFAIDKGVQQLISSLSETGARLGRVRDVDIHRLGYLVDRLLESLHHNLPEAERLLYSWADTIFAPKVVLRQYLMALGLEMTLFIYHLCYRLGARLVNRMTVKGRQISETRRRMAKAKNYYEWLKCAERMDELEGKNRWREVPESTLYNHRMLQEKINQFNNMMQNGDVFQLMFVLRGGISRNQFGLLNEGLYQHAYSGTKKIVERYLEVVVKALNFVCDVNPSLDNISADVKLAFFNETRHAFGRTALLLSGGAGLGFYHVGFVKALFDQGILPRVLSGASAGSIISSMIGVRTDDELYAMFTDGIARLDFFKLYKRRTKAAAAATATSGAGC